VLINPQWKTIYDCYGEKVLREGVKDSNGICNGGYVYQ
jgi:DnaJ-class molecular chaperone